MTATTFSAPALVELGRALARLFAEAVRLAAEAVRQLGRLIAAARTGHVPPWQVPAGQRRRDYGLVA